MQEEHVISRPPPNCVDIHKMRYHTVLQDTINFLYLEATNRDKTKYIDLIYLIQDTSINFQVANPG